MLAWLRAQPTALKIALLVCLQLAAMTLVGLAGSHSWSQAIVWGVDMLALLYGAHWWDGWRARRLTTDRTLGSGVMVAGRTLPVWARPALVMYAATLCGLMLMRAAAGWHPIGRDVILAAVLAALLTGMTVAIYNRGLSRSPSGPRPAPPKSRASL